MENSVARKNSLTFSEINPLDHDQIRLAAEGKVLKLDMSETYWTPLNIGETKRLIFQEVRTESMPSFTNKNVLVELPVAIFVEVLRNEKTGEITQQMVKTAATKVVSFINSKNLPRHACMEVEYKGKARAKNGNSYDNFAFYLVIQDVHIEPETVEAEEVR